MMLKSIKFGGTSMGNAKSIEECAKIIKAKSEKFKIIVTVSAVDDITNQLMQIISYAKKNKSRLVKSKIIYVSNIHKTILKNLLNNNQKTKLVWDQEFAPILNKLEAISYGASLVGDLTDKTIARICAFGEKMSSILMVYALDKIYVKSFKVESERIIKTNSNYLKATVDFQATNLSSKKILKPILAKGIIPIVTGFIGKDANANITLLGRGSSDYTASILAMVLNASEIEIWTDVNGIMTADPKIVKDSFSWNNLDMNIMSEMAYSGAKVIHPDTIALAVKKNIAVYVYNTFDRSFTGTKITSVAQYARGIVANTCNTLITLENTNIINRVGFIKAVTSIVAESNISIDVCATSEISFTFSIKSQDFSKKLQKSLENFASIKIKNKVTKLCIIGNQVTSDKTLLAGIFKLCQELNVAIYTISVSASGTNITLIIDEDKTGVMLRSLHSAFLKKKNLVQ